MMVGRFNTTSQTRASYRVVVMTRSRVSRERSQNLVDSV